MTLLRTHKWLVSLKVIPLMIKEGFVKNYFNLHPRDNSLKHVWISFLVAFNGGRKRVQWKVTDRFRSTGLNSSACHYISPEKCEWSNICCFLSPGALCMCVCECAI